LRCISQKILPGVELFSQLVHFSLKHLSHHTFDNSPVSFSHLWQNPVTTRILSFGGISFNTSILTNRTKRGRVEAFNMFILSSLSLKWKVESMSNNWWPTCCVMDGAKNAMNVMNTMNAMNAGMQEQTMIFIMLDMVLNRLVEEIYRLIKQFVFQFLYE